MASFDFISDEELRATLAADYDEMTRCMGVEAWKAAQALAGGIVEAILLDYLLTIGHQQHKGKDVMTLELGPLIGAAKEAGIISERTERMSDVVRDSRNLIHPGKVRRGGETATKDTAQVAQALVNIIIEEVGAKRRETYGLTAAQVVDIVMRNPTSLTILHHLLKEMKQLIEWERLLTTALPDAYFGQLAILPFELEPDYSPAFAENVLERMRVLERCFMEALHDAPEDAKAKAARNFIRILREESESRVLTYEASFFRCTELRHLTPDEQEIVKAHVLSRFAGGGENLAMVLAVTRGIGRYLTPAEGGQYANAVCRGIQQSIATGSHPPVETLLIIGGEREAMSRNARLMFDTTLDAWIDAANSRDQPEWVEALVMLRNFWAPIGEPPVEGIE